MVPRKKLLALTGSRAASCYGRQAWAVSGDARNWRKSRWGQQSASTVVSGCLGSHLAECLMGAFSLLESQLTSGVGPTSQRCEVT